MVVDNTSAPQVAVDRIGWCFDRSSRRLALKLIETQMWCFGADIRRSEGNLLIEFGFVRDRPPEGISGSTSYRIHWEGLDVTLWGFSALFSQEELGSLTFKRHEWEPRWTSMKIAPQNLWQAGAMPRLGTPCGVGEWKSARALLRRAVDFLVHYEQAIDTKLGPVYRHVVKQGHPDRKRSILLEDLATSWKGLGRII